MKRGLVILASAAALAGASQANAMVIANWTFEVSVPTTAGPHAAEIGTGTALGFHTDGTTTYSNPAGNGSVESFSSNAWTVGDYYQFSVSTAGMNSIKFTFDQTSSNTGPRDFQVQYSTDGSSFTNFGSPYAVLANSSPNPVWNSTTSSPLYTNVVDLSSVSALNNQASIWLRLTDASTTSANGGTVAVGGTDRVDNVLIEGTQAVPEPATLAVLGIGAAALLRRRRK